MSSLFWSPYIRTKFANRSCEDHLTYNFDSRSQGKTIGIVQGLRSRKSPIVKSMLFRAEYPRKRSRTIFQALSKAYGCLPSYDLRSKFLREMQKEFNQIYAAGYRRISQKKTEVFASFPLITIIDAHFAMSIGDRSVAEKLRQSLNGRTQVG